MNTSSLTDGRAHIWRMIVLLAAMLAALTVLMSLAHPRSSEAQEAQTVTIDPSNIGFGAVTLSADPQTRTVTITNNGLAAITIGSIDYSGLLGTETGTFTTSIGPGGLLVGAGQTATLDVDFDPVTSGFKQATGTIKDLLGVEIEGAPQVIVSGTGVATQPAGTPSDCTIVGTSRGETLTGTSNNDVICGMGGGDKINGQRGNDVERGGSGNDRITDHKGKDRLLGQKGRDRLNARDHARGDVLKGGGGRDRAVEDKRDRARGI
jgi:Ca2+-binding RTX toxin-like protein